MTIETSRKYVRLSPATWAEIRAHWETGEPTLEELSARYDVTTRTLQSHFAKHKTVKGAEAQKMAAAVQQAIFADNLDDRETRVRKGRETRWAAIANAEKIEGLMLAQLEQSSRDPAAAFKAGAMVKMLGIAAQCLQRTHDMKWKALGLDRAKDTDELPEIHIIDISGEEARRMAAAQRDGDDDTDWACGPSVSSSDQGTSTEDDEIVIEGGSPTIEG